MLSNCGTLESCLDCKEIKPVNPKGHQPWIFIGRTEAEVPILSPSIQRAKSLQKTLMLRKTEDKRSGWQRMKWLDSITNSLDMNLSNLCEIVKDRGAWMLQSVRLQSRAGLCKGTTEQQQIILKKILWFNSTQFWLLQSFMLLKWKKKSKWIHYFVFFRVKFCIGLFDLKKKGWKN